MDTRNFRLDKWLLIVSILIIVGFVTTISWYNLVIDEEIYNSARTEVEEISERIQMRLADEIDESKDDLFLLADNIEETNITSETAVAYFEKQSQVSEFENIYYISLDGIGISVKNGRVDFENNETFNSALQNESLIEAPLISADSGQSIMNIAVPIMNEDEVEAVLFAEYSLEEVYEDIEGIISGNGYAFIVDSNGDMVYNTSSKGTEDLAMDLYTSPIMGEIKNDLADEKSGNLYFQVDSIEQIAVYSPVEATTWSVVVTVSSDAINQELRTSINLIIVVSMIVVFLLILFTAYAGYSKISSLKSIEKSAYYDPLTKLPNLTKIKKDMRAILEKNKDKKYSVIKIDVENFKAVNEMFGFDIGNRVLRAFKTIRETVDEPTLMIARIGVDEFLLFSGNGFLDDMEKRTNTYESYYKELIPELGDYRISFKYGRYHIAKGEIDVDDIVTKVNMAHRISKDRKGLIIYDYNDSYKQEIVEIAEITNKMKTALDNDEFQLYLQPKFSVVDNSIVGAEALVRWVEPNGNCIFPDKFIPLFEKNGFIVEMDAYMLEATCAVIKKWRDTGFGHIPISVNCSRLNLNNPSFVQEFAEIVDRYEIPHQYIEMELTESAMIENEEVIEYLFAELDKFGFRISIDDFGSGYSSLGLLKNLRADTLKLDRSFFINNKDLVRGDLVVDGIIKLAQSLNMYVVAEGIEEKTQVKFLKQIGCDAVQGYYYAKPMSILEFEEKYRGMMPEYLSILHKTVISTSNPLVIENQKLEMALNVLNAVRVPTTIFTHSLNELKYNTVALELFGMDDQIMMGEDFFALSPTMQPSGAVSKIQALENIDAAKKNGHIKFMWVHRNLMGEEIPCEVTIEKLHLLDDNGEELYISVIHDLREELADYETKRENETNGFLLNRLTDKALINEITGLTDECFFKYDTLKSTIQFLGGGNTTLEQLKGSHSFPNKEFVSLVVYQDDIELFYQFVDAMNQGREEIFEIRLNLPEGGFRYCVFEFTNIQNELGEPVFSVGKIYDITDRKLLEEQATKDLLTNCYNKISTETLIKTILEENSQESHALFVVDIDDFKSVNDSLGHAFGDNVLREVARNLHEHFREGDIIGRIGGDEFVVFLKNIGNLDVIENKAKAIAAAFKNKYTGESKEYKVSGSVGISVYPENGTVYSELFDAADKALYQSKLAGKDRYTFYSEEISEGTMRNLTLLENVSRGSDAYFNTKLVSEVFELLYEMKTKDISLDTILEYIGRQLKVSRCYIFESFDKGETYSEIYEWHEDSVQSQKNELQDVPKDVLCEFVEELEEKGIFFCDDESQLQLDSSKYLMVSGDVKSLLLLHIKDTKEAYTRICLGLDDCKEKRVWTEKEINSLRYILKMLSIFIVLN